MSSLVRPLAKSVATNAIRRQAPIRGFHSPFVALGQARAVQSQQQQQGNKEKNPYTIYEKQCDFSSEPLPISFANRTYVVSQPDASASHYEVPSGAYPTSSPYVNFAPTNEVPSYRDAQVSSTSSTLAHEFTTSTGAVPHHFGGIGASSAVRYRAAPGEMGEMGGSFGGLELMDREGVKAPVQGQQQLAERNPQPDDPVVAEKNSMAGLDGAWKLRK